MKAKDSENHEDEGNQLHQTVEVVLDPMQIVQDATEEVKNNNISGLLKVQPMNKSMDEASKMPNPTMLFDCFLTQGEMAFLFAGTGLGKTVLAHEIADKVSKGEGIVGLKNESMPIPVLLLDCELSKKQQQKRYSDDYGNNYTFALNFFRAELHYDDLEEYSEEGIIKSLVLAIEEHGIKLIIVDNISYLQSDNEKAKYAAKLMKYLKGIKEKHGISILILAHTPKRDESREISVNDLAGSKALANFADSIFAMGMSTKDPAYRYLKQIKARNTEMIYHSNNVVVLRLGRVRHDFLGFDFVEFGREREHLKRIDFDNDREQLVSDAKDLHERGFSQREIATELGVSLGSVNKYLNTVQPVQPVHGVQEVDTVHGEHEQSDDEIDELPF